MPVIIAITDEIQLTGNTTGSQTCSVNGMMQDVGQNSTSMEAHIYYTVI